MRASAAAIFVRGIRWPAGANGSIILPLRASRPEGGAARVAKQPTISILATGDEIVSPGMVPKVDQIFDALSLPIGLRAQSAGAIIGGSERIGDDPALLAAMLERLLPSDIFVMIRRCIRRAPRSCASRHCGARLFDRRAFRANQAGETVLVCVRR
jgi:hypothetical protein